MKNLSVVVVCLAISFMAASTRADSVRAESVNASGSSAVVRLFISDTGGTPLGMDAGATKRIQGIAVKATFSPASSIASASISKSGVLASLTPLFESTPSSAGSVTYLASFSESASPIPFTLNSSAGNEFARVNVTLSASASPGSVITVELSAGTTSLTNQAGTISETASNGLALVPGSITAAPMTASFTSSSLQLAAESRGELKLSLSKAAPEPLTIALTSSSPAVASAGSSVNAAAGAKVITIPVTSGSTGVATVKATLPASVGGGSATATVHVVAAPSAPAGPVPADAAVNVLPSGTLRWGAVNSAATYAVDVGKQNPPADKSFTASAPSVEVQLEPATTYYWRVTAENAAGSTSGSVWSFKTADVAVCRAPDPPMLAAPAEVISGAGYDVTWQSIAHATEVEIEQSEDPNFATAAPRTAAASARLASYSNVSTADQRFYYRARARNTVTDCGLTSGYSNIVTVLVKGILLRILPVAGSAQGSLGSLFRTSLQLHNAGSSLIAGTVIFHPAGRSGLASDPQLVYALGPRETRSWADVVASIGTSGIGSLEIESSLGELPRVVARIYNDAGANGTSGLTAPLIDPADALDSSTSAVLIAPPDAAKARFNIGVRTLADPTTLRFTVFGPAGQTLGTVTADYPPAYFEQRSATELVRVPVGSDCTIEIAVVTGRAIVYGATTDNITQDPSIQIATRN